MKIEQCHSYNLNHNPAAAVYSTTLDGKKKDINNKMMVTLLSQGMSVTFLPTHTVTKHQFLTLSI